MNYEDEDQVPLTPAERLLANAYRGSNNNVEWSSDIPDWVQREIGRRNEQLARPESESVFARLQTRQVEDVAGNPVTQLSYWRKDQQTKFPDKAYNLYYNQQFDALGVSDPYSSTVRFFTGQVNAERVAQDAETPLFSRRSRDQVFSDFVRRPSMMFREPDAGFAAPHFKMNRNELSAEVFVNLQGSYQLPKSREVFNKKGEIFEKRMFAQDSMAAVEFVRGSTGNRTLTPFKSLVVDPGNLFGKTALPFGQDRLFSEKAKDHRREFREKNAIGRNPTQVGSLDQPAFRYAGSPTKSGTRAAHMWVDDYGFFSEGGAFTLHNDLQVMSPSQFRIQGSAGMSAKDLEAQGFVVGAVYGQQKPEWEMEGGLHYAGDRAELGGYHVGNNEHAYVGGLTRMEGGDWVATMVGVNPFHNAENKPSAFMKDQMQPVTENHVLMQMGKKILGKFPASIQPMPLKDERLPSMALRIFMAHEQGAKGVYGDLMGLAEEKGMDTEKIKSAIQFVGRGGRKTQRANSARMLDINTDDPEINGLLLEAASRYTLKKSHQMPIEAYYSTQLVRQAKKDMPADDFKKRFGDLSDEDLDNAGANIHLQNYMVSAIAADILINPHKKTASGESNYDARRLNILARYNPEMAQDLMRMDAAGKFPNKNRRILKSELHQQGLIPDLPTIDSGAINWDEEYMGAMFDAPPRSTELDIQKQMFSRLAERHPGQYLTAAGQTFPMFKDLATGIHGDDYEEAQGTYAGRLATTLLNERKPEDFTRGASEAKTLLTQYLDGGRVRQKAASIALPALTGAVIGSPYVDQGFAVANAPDVSRLLKRMGYDKDVRKDMESAFLDTGLLSNLHMQTSNERTGLPMMNLISKQRGDELFPGIKDMVIPKGKMLMGQMDVGAQDKDYDSDLAEMILGGYVDRAVERKDPYIGRGDENLNYHKKIAQAGQGIEKLRGIAEKGYTKGKGVGGLVKSMEQMFKSGFEMSATHPPFVEFLNNFADEVGGQLGIGDDNRKALLNATAMVGNQPYQLAMDNEYSLSGATQYFKRAYREFSIGAPIGESKTRMSVFQNIKKDDPDKQAIPTKGILPGDSPKLALQLLDRAISMERGAKGDYEENHAMYVDNGDRQGYARFLSTALLPVNDAANTDRADHVYKALVKSFEAYGEHTKKSKSEPDLGMNHTGMIDVLQAIAGIEASDEEKDQFRGYLKEDNLVGLQRKDGSGAATKYVRKDNPLMDAALDLMVGSSGAENMNIFGLYAVGVGAANTKQNYHTDPVFTNANAGAPPLDYLGGVTADVRNHIQFRKGNLDSDRMAKLAPMRSMPGDTHMLRMQRAAGETAEYDRGGYTGDGMKHEEAGTVHKGEFVLNQEDVARIQQGRGDEVINHVERELMTDGDLLRTSAGFDGGGYNNGQNTWGGGAQSKAERDAQLRAQYARHGADWTGDEEGGLYNAFRSANVSTPEHLRDFIDSASESMQRSPGSINSRLRQNNLITQELFEQAENVLPFSDPASFPDDRLKVDNSPTPHAKKLAAKAGLMVDQIPLPAGADRLRKEHVQAYIDRRSERTHKRFADLRAGVNRKTGTPNYPSNNDINPGGRPRFGSDGFAGDSVLQGKPDTEAFITYEAGAGRVSEVTLRTRSTAAELDALIKRHTGAITQGMAMSADDFISAVDPEGLRLAADEIDRFIKMPGDQRELMSDRERLQFQSLTGELEAVQKGTRMLGAAAMGGNIPKEVQDVLTLVGQGLADADIYGLSGKSRIETERSLNKLAGEDAADAAWLADLQQGNISGRTELTDILAQQATDLGRFDRRAALANDEASARLSALDLDARKREVLAGQEAAEEASEVKFVRGRTARRGGMDADEAQFGRRQNARRDARLGIGTPSAAAPFQPEAGGMRQASRAASAEQVVRRRLQDAASIEADIDLVSSFQPDQDYSQTELANIGQAQRRLAAIDKAAGQAPKSMQMEDSQVALLGRVSSTVVQAESLGVTGKTAFAASTEAAKTAQRNAESRDKSLSANGITPFNVTAFEEIGKSLKSFAGTLGDLNNVVGHVTKGHEGYIKQAKQLTEIFNQEVNTLARADSALNAAKKSGGGLQDLSSEQRQVLDRADRQFTKDKTFREYLDAAAPKMQSMEREIMRQELKESGELPYQQIKGKEREELQWELLRSQHNKGGRERLEEAASQGFYDDFLGGVPGNRGIRGLSAVGNLARGFGNMVDPSFIWGTQAIGRFLMKPAQQAMKAYTDEQMVIGQSMLSSPSIDVAGLKDSTMFTVLNRRERQEDAQVAMGRQGMSAFGWMQDLFVGEKGTSSILGMLGGIGAPIAGAAGMLQMAAKGFGVGSIQGVPTGLAFGLPAAAISLGAYSLDNASNYYAQGGQKGVLGLFTNPEGTFGNAGSLLQQAFTPNTDRFYQQQGSEIYRTAVDMGATGQYTMDQLMRVSGDVTPLLGLGQTRRVSASDFGRSAVRAGVVERFVKDFQYQGLEVDEETSGRILSMWTSLNPARQIDYPVPDTQEAQQLGDIFVRGAVDPESFRDLLGQVAATRGVSANDTRGRQNIYNEYLDRMSFNPNVMQEMFDLGSTVPMLNQANTARRSVGLANLDDDYLTRFRSADRQQGEVQYQTWMSGRLSTFSFDQQQGDRVTDAMNNGDYAAANRMMSTDNAQNAQLQYYRDNGGALFGAGVNTSTQNMNRVEDYMKNEPQYARMGDEFRQQTMGLLGFTNPDVVDQLFNNFAPSNNRARLASSAAEMYAQGINPLEQVSRQLRQTFQAPTSGNVSRLATELVTNMSTQGGLSQSELDNMVVDTLTDEPIQALLNSSQMSGLSVNVSRGVKNRMAVDPAYTQAYSNSILGRDNMFVQTGSASMMAQYGMNAVLANFSPRAATYRQTGLDAASQMYGEYIARGSSDASFGALAGQVAGMNFADRTNALGMMQGDAMAWSRNQPGGAMAMYDPTTGMRSMYGSISREQYGRVQAASPGWATMPYEEGFSEFGIQSELMQNNRDSFNIGKKYQRIGMNMSYGMTTGDLGMAGAAFNELGMTLNMGNGMGQWQVEDAQRKLSREQSLFGTQQDTKNLDLAQREFGLQGQQFYEKFGLNQRQFQANTDYGRFQQSMGRTQQLAQREWNWEDFNFQGDQMEMEFSWQMDDYNRNIRYARGREKRDLMRNKSRDVTRFAMQSGQRDKVEDRMEQQNEWEDEVFAKEKEHFEQNVQFQQEEMDLSKRHFEQDRALQWERLNMQQEAHTKNVQWMMQKFALEDQAILLDRQSYQANFASQQQELAQMTALQQRAMELQNTLAAITGYYERIGAALSVVDVNAITAALGGAQNPLPGSYTGYSGTAAIQGVAAAPNMNSLPTGVTDALTALYNSYNAPGNNATRPAQGRYASGGYTGRGAKYDAAGVVHRGEYVVPQEGAMVIRGDDPVRAEADQKMLDLMAENNRLLAMIYASPAQYQTIVNGKVVDTMPLEKATRARL